MTQQFEGTAAVILAAGKGTRMKSRLSKVLHPVLGEPMLFHALRAIAQTGIPPERTVVVVGYQGGQVRQAVAERGKYLFAEQTEQLGTGHALMMAAPLLRQLPSDQTQQVMLMYGDNALIRSDTLLNLLNSHHQKSPLITLASANLIDPTGYGRIIRDQGGNFQHIIEQLDLSPAQKLISEINAGVYVYQAGWLWEALPKIKKSPKGEYYLTDLAGLSEETCPGSVQAKLIEAEEMLGINDLVQLAEVSQILRQRILREWMLAGVTISDPASTFISAESQLEPDVVIEANTHLRGQCRVGAGSVIGPNTILTNARIGQDCRVLTSAIENSTLEDRVEIGPFSHIRPGSHLENGVHLGNFAEVSRSRLGQGTKQGHFSFLGDATVGPGVNVGAGTITANYDGQTKNKTFIGARVFLGCDTILRAPLSVGEEARTGAGSVVTRNVEPGVTVVGMPARPIRRRAVTKSQEPASEETKQ